MSKRIVVWGREFNLPVDYDILPDEKILDSQLKSLDSFLDNADVIFASVSEISDYCIKKNRKEIGDSIENIYKYVMPQKIFVKRSEKKKKIAILCDYKFDPEHGLAVVVENNKVVEIGPQDIIL